MHNRLEQPDWTVDTGHGICDKYKMTIRMTTIGPYDNGRSRVFLKGLR